MAWKTVCSASRPSAAALRCLSRGPAHNVTNVEVLAERDNEVDVRYNFNTLSHRYRATDFFFGTMFVTLRKVNDALLISNKRIVLKNDYIRQVLDIYHV